MDRRIPRRRTFNTWLLMRQRYDNAIGQLARRAARFRAQGGKLPAPMYWHEFLTSWGAGMEEHVALDAAQAWWAQEMDEYLPWNS